jgi:hypothetical protein
MKKFAILACFLMLLLGFGCISVNATECVELSGTIIGAYENVWCEEPLEKIPLSGVTVKIEKIDDGVVSAKTTTVTGCDGSFSQTVKKGTFFNPETYRVSFKTISKVIDGETYYFEGQSKTVSVKGSDVTVNFNPAGEISFTKNIIKSFLRIDIDFIIQLIKTFFAKFA